MYVSSTVVINSASVPRKSERIAARAVDGKALVIALDERRIHKLNAVGTCVLEQCDGANDVKAIAEQVARRFQVDASTAERDAVTFLQQLAAHGVIELEPGAQP